MIPFRRYAGLIGVALGLILVWPHQAGAAAEVHRLSLVLSSNPTSITAGEFNDAIDLYNRTHPRAQGLDGIDQISNGWYFQGEFRYFVRPNVAVSAGAGQIRSIQRRELLPRISQVIQLRAEVLTAPLHAGAAYYLTPYNQGDFQARAYLGGGFLALTNNKAVIEQLQSNTDSLTSLPDGSFRIQGEGDSPGYYLEIGTHMFFAVRYSVLLGATYRSAKIRSLVTRREVVDNRTGETVRVPAQPFTLDMSGVSARMSVAIGF